MIASILVKEDTARKSREKLSHKRSIKGYEKLNYFTVGYIF